LSGQQGSGILSALDMDDPSATPGSPAGGGADGRLESWKAIAAYLGRGVTTVQRWERDEALPVRRHAHAARGSVFAYQRDLDEWRRRREATGLPSLPPSDAPVTDQGAAGSVTPSEAPRRRRYGRLDGIAAVGVGAAAIVE
jgi:hypothetical protein